jgi:hypothetical protein
VSGEIQVMGVDIDMPLGQLTVGDLEIARNGVAEPFKWSFRTLQSDSFFVCRDEHGKYHAPFGGRLREFCVPRRVFGGGFTLLEFQKDPYLSRVAARWLELIGIINPLRNGMSAEALRRRFHLIAGLGFDTYHWDFENGIREMYVVSRFRFGWEGLLRSRNSRWEAFTRFNFRPALISPFGTFQDQGIEFELSGYHHLPIKKVVLMSLGINTQVSHFNRPSTSLGVFSSGRNSLQWNVLFSIGGRFEYAGY